MPFQLTKQAFERYSIILHEYLDDDTMLKTEENIHHQQQLIIIDKNFNDSITGIV